MGLRGRTREISAWHVGQVKALCRQFAMCISKQEAHILCGACPSPCGLSWSLIRS